MKVCTKCLASKPLEAFGTSKSYPDGLKYWCKPCEASYSAAYRKATAERIRERRRSYALANPEAIKEAKKRWEQSNPEAVREIKRRWRLANPEKQRNAVQRWELAHPESALAKQHRRRARLQGNGIFTISDRQMERLYSSKCVYCGSGEDIHADHVLPIALGGRHSIGNLVPACAKCNLSKGAKMLSAWRYRERLKHSA